MYPEYSLNHRTTQSYLTDLRVDLQVCEFVAVEVAARRAPLVVRYSIKNKSLKQRVSWIASQLSSFFLVCLALYCDLRS